MARNNKTAKPNIPMCVAGVLFCLTLISVYMTSGLYAKYTVSQTAGEDARVIKFGDITLIESGDFGEDGTLRIIPGVDLEKKAVVSFSGSEASTYAFVKLTLSPHWGTSDSRSFAVANGGKTQMQWKVAEEWQFLKTDDSGSYIYYRELEPGVPLEADIIADNGLIAVSDKITGKDIAAMTGIYIEISAAAVQNGGFADADAAWNSIALKEG